MEWFLNMGTIGNWLLQSTFQAIVLILIIFLIKFLMRRNLPARWHYALWMLLIVRMVFPWGLSSEFGISDLVPQQARQSAFEFVLTDLSKKSASIPEQQLSFKQIDVGVQKSNPVVASSEVAIETSQSEDSAGIFTGMRVADLLLGIWLLGVLILSVAVFRANLRLWLALRRDKKLDCKESLALFEECRRDLGIKASLDVLETDQVKTPALFGFLKTRLLLPVGFVETLSKTALRHVFLHELAHIKRRDVFVGWVMTILQIIHWFNPLVWFAFRRMRSDRELATDGLALSIMKPNEPMQYGHTIIQMLKLYSKPSPLPAMTGVLEQNSNVKRRMEMISDFKKNSYKWSPVAIAVLVVVGCMSLPEADLDTKEEKETPTLETAEKATQEKSLKEQKRCIKEGLKEQLLSCDFTKEKQASSQGKEAKQCDENFVKTTWDKAVKLHVETVGNEKEKGTQDLKVMNQVVGMYDELLECANLDELQIDGLDEENRPTFYRTRFYKAELFWNMEDWNRCGDAYHELVVADPDEEFSEEAAYAEVLCYNKMYDAKYDSKDKKDKPEVKLPLVKKDVEEADAKWAASFRRFACGSPEHKDAADIKYRRARIHYEANRFEEAAILFKDIVFSYPEHRLAAYAANLHLDCLNSLGRLIDHPNPSCVDELAKMVGVFMDAQKAPGRQLMEDEEFASQIKALSTSMEFVPSP